MSFVHSQPQKKRWISLTPLIDVVFILLMFFMLTTQFSRYGVMSIGVGNVNEANATVAAVDSVRINVYPNNIWALNDSSELLLSESNLSELVGGKSIVVKADDSAQLQDVVALFDALTKAGITNAVWLPSNEDGDR